MDEQQSKLVRKTTRVEKIVSGGQTGVERAALDAAIFVGLLHGGWCPNGRRAEDGPIAACYELEELESTQYADRTKRNVLDSDATLVLYTNVLQGGTFLTWRYAVKQCKPCLKICLTHPGRVQRVRDWLTRNQVRTLNIAGPRASKEPGGYDLAFEYLMLLFGKGK